MRSRKKQQTTVRLEPEVFEIVEEESQNSGMSRAEVIRRLLNQAISEVQPSFTGVFVDKSLELEKESETKEKKNKHGVLFQ